MEVEVYNLCTITEIHAYYHWPEGWEDDDDIDKHLVVVFYYMKIKSPGMLFMSRHLIQDNPRRVRLSFTIDLLRKSIGPGGIWFEGDAVLHEECLLK